MHKLLFEKIIIDFVSPCAATGDGGLETGYLIRKKSDTTTIDETRIKTSQ